MANSQLLQPAATFKFSLPKLLGNPGLLYNFGNLISVLAACADCVIAAKIAGQSEAPNFVNYFFGTWPAIFTSLAAAIFLVSGNAYAAAWKHGFLPDQKYNSHGHALSVCGALLIGFALLGLAQGTVAILLAMITTILHAGGKLGSLVAPNDDANFKLMPLFSRVTYLATLTLDITSHIQLGGFDLSKLMLPLGLIAATLFWARADWLLRPRVNRET